MISEHEAESIAAANLRERVPCFSASDTIRVDWILDRIHLEYIAESATSSSCDKTYIQLRYYPAQQLVWIHYLHVASEFRSQGLGRRLRQAAEEVARELGAESVFVFPLTRARSFWERAGYEPNPRTARVLTKQLHQ